MEFVPDKPSLQFVPDEAAGPSPVGSEQPGGNELDNLVEGLGRRFTRFGNGLRQFYHQGKMATASELMNDPETAQHGATMYANAQQGLNQVNADIAEHAKLDKPLMATTGGKIGDFAGAALPYAAAPEGLLAQGAVGAATGAAEPVEEGGLSRPAQTGIGALGGAAGPLLGKAAGAVEAYTRPIMSDVAKNASKFLESLGITMSAGQKIGRDLPMTGTFEKNQADQLTSATLKHMGVDSPIASSKVMDTGRRVLQNTYDDLAARLTVNTKDPVFLRSLNQAGAEADEYLTPQAAAVVKKQIAGIQQRIAENGSTMNGTLFKNLHDGLDKVTEPTTTPIIEDLQQAMRQAMTRSSSKQDAALLAKTDQRYGAMKTIEKAIGPDDKVDPDMLWRAVDTKKNAAAAVYGRGPNAPLAQLAQASKAVLGTAPGGGAVIDFLGNIAKRHATYAAIGGLEGYREGGMSAAIKGAALAIGGHKLVAVLNSNPQAAKAFAQYVSKQSSIFGGGTAQEMTGGNPNAEQGQTPQ